MGEPAETLELTNDRKMLTRLTEAQRQRALDRFRLLRPFLEGGVSLARVAAEREMLLLTVAKGRRVSFCPSLKRPC